MKQDFLKHVTASIENLLNEVLLDNSYSLFRRGPRVVSGTPFTVTSSDYHLYFTGYEVLERDHNTYRADDGNGGVVVLRTPDRIRLDYALLVSQSALRNDAWDRLIAYFFDTRAVEPFLPESLKNSPAIYQRLAQEKAIFTLKSANAPALMATGQEPLTLSLSYTGLYHTGEVLNRESLVKQRIIEYRNRERSTT